MGRSARKQSQCHHDTVEVRITTRAEQGRRPGRKPETAPREDTSRRPFLPLNERQAQCIESIDRNPVSFLIGPAGSGKTYIAVAKAVTLLETGKVRKLILSRPAVEAGERLGALPGGFKEKVDPFLRPLYDVLDERIGAKETQALIRTNVIEICPLAYMRGRTLSEAAVILDEAQNATLTQLKMFLTRLGAGSRMVISGDPGQYDIPQSQSVLGTLARNFNRDGGTPGVGVVEMKVDDIVRHPVLANILSKLEDMVF